MSLPFRKLVDQRPWGNFTQYTHNQDSTVKIIEVLPGNKLSTQRHSLRDEFWVALDSGLVAYIDGDKLSLSTGQEVWIPRGTIHSMENVGDTAARFLEIAFGNFNELDIERLEDLYGRAK